MGKLAFKLKMFEPYYEGLQGNEIPVVKKEDEKIHVQVIVEKFDVVDRPFKPSTDLSVNE
ncbi:MAG: hypothetical protein H7336_14090 [Bacteriovorax sp.]|nr:hypothetical protein [Bacteriovorax sp.]